MPLVVPQYPSRTAGRDRDHRANNRLQDRLESRPGAIRQSLQSHRALYHPKQATRTLVSLPRPRERVRFKVPDVPSGRYVMIIYDGSEGGSHYTYARFIVEKAPRSRTHPAALPFTGAPPQRYFRLQPFFSLRLASF